MKIKKIGFITPGQILLEEFLKPFDVYPNKLAIELKVPSSRIYGIIKGERSITADTGLRLSKYFGTSQCFWLGLQADHAIDIAKESIESELETIKRNEDLEDKYTKAV